MSECEVENSSSNYVNSEEVACQIKAVTDPLSLQLKRLCELLRELREEQSGRRYKETLVLYQALEFRYDNTLNSDECGRR